MLSLLLMQTLALCTATLIFVLTKDQMNVDFDRNSLGKIIVYFLCHICIVTVKDIYY